MIKRGLQQYILDDLTSHQKMIFVPGPRQCGKTTLARMMLEEADTGLYWNFDIPEDRLKLVREPAFYEEVDRMRGARPLIVFDELHKYADWKNYLKGAFDRSGSEFNFLVTGSGRLDLYRKGGDSLAGRYFLHHLFPMTIGELAGDIVSADEFFKKPDELPEPCKDSWNTWNNLETLSGFPEPFLSQKETFYRRWSAAYRSQVIKEDIRDLTRIRNLSGMEMLAMILPEKVGGLLSMNALREDLNIAFETVRSWITVLENFFLVFTITPWSRAVARSIKKEPKLYFYDWAMVRDPAARFENMVALHLYRAVTEWSEKGLGDFRLHFIRDRQKREVDFAVSRDQDLMMLIEAKMTETEPSAALVRMGERFGVPSIQLVNRPGVSRKVKRKGRRVLVSSADTWLCSLP